MEKKIPSEIEVYSNLAFDPLKTFIGHSLNVHDNLSLNKFILLLTYTTLPHKLLSLLILLTLLYGFIGCGAKSGSGGLDWSRVEWNVVDIPSTVRTTEHLRC